MKEEKEKLKKYYAQVRGNMTIRKIMARNDDEAIQKARELLGEDVIVGNLRKGVTKERKKELDKIANEAFAKIMRL